jgi:hypothetical protein
MTQAEVEKWLAIRKEAGLHIDPDTAEVEWIYALTCDPYGVYPELPEEYQQVGREYFARSPGSDVWVEFGDLPKATQDALWQKLGRQPAKPGNVDSLMPFLFRLTMQAKDPPKSGRSNDQRDRLTNVANLAERKHGTGRGVSWRCVPSRLISGTAQGTSPSPSARTSSPVATNNTPGMRLAAVASTRLICACATGERSTKACVIRGRITSSV